MLEERTDAEAAEAPEPERRLADFSRAVEVAARLEENVGRVVRGKSREIRLVLTALACRGHVLFEDVPEPPRPC